jgi:cytoskeletal protein CcmA (bactofilin family)
MDQTNNDRYGEENSLESPATVIEPTGKAGTATSVAAGATSGDTEASPAVPGGSAIRRLLRRLNVYLLLFILILILAAVGTTLVYLAAHRESTATNIPAAQSLSSSTLNSLANSDVTVGEPKHTLSVESNAEFSGSVLMRSNLQVAGTLQIGSNLALNGIRVTGNSTFDDVQITKSLATTGNGSFQGQLSVQKNLNVSGGATFLGSVSAPSLNVDSLQLSGDLTLIHHLTAGGSTPSRSNGPALGSGGTVSVSGSDTAGSVTINTGTSPAAGCFVTVNFTQHFNSTPHMVLTPIGPGAAGLSYYLNRSTSSFSVCSTSAAPGNTTFGFDYVAFD